MTLSLGGGILNKNPEFRSKWAYKDILIDVGAGHGVGLVGNPEYAWAHDCCVALDLAAGRSAWIGMTAGSAERPGDKLTIAEVCADLDISRRTFYEWRAKGRAPKCIPLAQWRAARPSLRIPAVA